MQNTFTCQIVHVYSKLRQLDVLLGFVLDASTQACLNQSESDTPPKSKKKSKRKMLDTSWEGLTFTPTVLQAWADSFRSLPDGQVGMFWQKFCSRLHSEIELKAKSSRGVKRQRLLDSEKVNIDMINLSSSVMVIELLIVFLKNTPVTAHNASVHRQGLTLLHDTVLEPFFENHGVGR